MANFVHVIPNQLWEELNEKGLLDGAFPDSKPSKLEHLLSNVPFTLKDQIETLAHKIDWNSKFELIIDSVPIHGSNIISLLTKYLTKSKQFDYLKGSDTLKALLEPSTKAINPSEPSLIQQPGKPIKKRGRPKKLIGRGSHGGHPKVLKEKISITKSSRGFPGSFFFY